jgi:imidazolonepropionase-like amidohydrolase
VRVKKFLCSCFLFFLASALAPGQAATPTPQNVLALTNVTVIDTTGSRPGERATVLIKGDRISEIGEPGKVSIPTGAQTVDGTGKYLLPGLWDMHMHLSLVSDSAFPLFIANGVTGVCDMGGDLDQIDQWREQITKGTRPGPRIIRAGPIVDGPRKEEGQYRHTVNNAAEARQAVESLKKRAVDFIKVYHFLPRDSYFALADEAKKQGISFAGHIPNGVSPREASDAGQRRLEHTAVLLQALVALENKEGRTQKQLTADAFDKLAGEEGTALFRAMAKNGTWHTPTLVVAQSFLLRAEMAAKPDDRRKYVAAITKEHWEKNNPVPQNVSAEDMAERKTALEKMLQIVGAMRRAGVSILAGTDPPTRDVFPGFSLHDELGLLVRAGLTPLEAIQAATLNAAKCLGLSDSYGMIVKGKVADLVLLEADPLGDIANTRKIAAVVAAGKYFGRPALDEMLHKVEEAVKPK